MPGLWRPPPPLPQPQVHLVQGSVAEIVNDPPFGHKGRTDEVLSLILTSWRPPPPLPQQGRHVPASVSAVPENPPPFNIPLPSLWRILQSWRPPPPPLERRPLGSALLPAVVYIPVPLPDTLIFCVDNLLLAATLSSNQTILKPLANLQNPLRLVKTRLNGVSNVQIAVDLGSAQTVQAAILFDTNMTAAGTVEVHSSTDNFSSSDTLEGTLTIGSQPFQLCHPLFLSASVSRRYWRFVCTDASNPDGFIEWGVGYLGPVTSLGRKAAPDVQMRVIDPSRLVRSPAGSPLPTPGVTRRAIALSVPALAEATAWQPLLDLLMEVGTSTDLFVCLWPQHSDATQLKRGTLYGAFTQLGALVTRASVARSVDLRQVTIEES